MGTSWTAEQQRVHAWQQEEQRAWRHDEQASRRPRSSTEQWHHRHASSRWKHVSAKNTRKIRHKTDSATFITWGQTCCVLRACRIPSQTGINDSINPKLISHMFVCSGSWKLKDKLLCCNDQVWLCLLNHRALFSPHGKIKKAAEGFQWWTTTRKELSHDNCAAS